MLVLATWLLLAVAGFTAALGVVGPGLFDRLAAGEPSVAGEATRGQDLLAAASTTGPSVTLIVDGAAPGDPALAAPLEAARADLLAVDGVASVTDPLSVPGGPDSAQAAGLVAADGEGLLVTAVLDDGLDEPAQDEAVAAVQERLEGLGSTLEADVPGVSTLVGGGTILFEAVAHQVEQDLVTGELIALPVSLLVMVLVFGGLAAAGMPMLGAVASIGGALASLLGFSYLTDLDASVVNVVTVLGLGLCIDYGLLVVSRFREELRALPASSAGRHRAGGPRVAPDAVAAALAATTATAGRTVVFSAVTVAISLSGLLLFEAEILRAVGAAGVSVVLVALLVALTLVPALLAVAGGSMLRRGVVSRVPGLRRVLAAFGDVPPPEGFFSRLARRVQRRPWLVVAGVLTVLGLAAAPALDIELRSSGAQLLPVDAPERVFFDTLAAEFPTASIPPVQVVGRASPEAMAPLAEQAAGLDGVRAVSPPQPVGQDLAVVSVFTAGTDPGSDAAKAVVAALRDERPGYETWVTGQTATLVDFSDALVDQAPRAGAVVVGATFVLLFLMTGSVLIPVKALAMNVVSLGASFGVLVWVFQDGNGEDLLGFTSVGGIETVIPMLVLAFGFGLAMDYEVFLLARVAELRRSGLGNDAAVVAGLQRSGRIITSAALVVVLVFSGFVAGELLVIKQTGVALAVAVAVDATLVRCLLVPATMTLLGEWNWWAPGPLRRLHARIGVRH